MTADDIPAEAGANEQAAPAPQAAGPASTSTDPRQLLSDNACLGCHVLDGAGGPVGPSFDGIGSRLDAAGIRTAILDPNAEISAGYEQMAGMMPANFGEQFSAGQLEAVVEFLAERK